MDSVNRHHLLHALAAIVVGLLGGGRGGRARPGLDPPRVAWLRQHRPVGAIYLHHHHHARVLAGAWPGVDPNQMVPEGLPLAALNGGNTMEMWIPLAIRAVLSWPAWFSLGTPRVDSDSGAVVPAARTGSVGASWCFARGGSRLGDVAFLSGRGPSAWSAHPAGLGGGTAGCFRCLRWATDDGDAARSVWR